MKGANDNDTPLTPAEISTNDPETVERLRRGRTEPIRESAYLTIAQAARDWDETSEETIQEAVCRWANAGHAEVHYCGDVYIEDPMRGHYLDDDRMAKLVAWMRSEGMLPEAVQS